MLPPIYRTISYIRSSFTSAYARQIKVHSSTFRILRDTNCIEYGPLWYCLVGNRLSFFGGDLWIQLPHVTRGLLTMEKMVSWSSAAKVKRRRLPECWKGVNWWGWRLAAHCSVCFKKISVDLVHKFWPFMEVHFQKFGPHRCFSERHVTMIQRWINQYGNLGTGMLG